MARRKTRRRGTRERRPEGRGRRLHKGSRQKQKAGTEGADEVEKFTYQKVFTQDDADS